MHLNMLKLEQEYEDWLKENCECDPSPIYYDDFQPCTCLTFEDWLDEWQEDQAEMKCDF